MLRRLYARFLERTMPWYNPRADAKRREETERFRRRSIAARIALEQLDDVGKRYERFDGVIR